MIGSVWWAHSTVLTAARSEPVGGDGGEEDRLTGLPGILSVCSTLCIELSRDAKPNDIGPKKKIISISDSYTYTTQQHIFISILVVTVYS